MRFSQIIAGCVATAALSPLARAVEPNEYFASRTILSPGLLSVSDELAAGNDDQPDTLLGIRDKSGSIYRINNDGNWWSGNGHASAETVVTPNYDSTLPTVSSVEISFSVTGFPDELFGGSHSEQGEYRVFVALYNTLDDRIIGYLTEDRTLEPGAVHDFSYIVTPFGYYDVYIDNTIGGAFDVDFFTFVDLTPGAAFTAETFALENSGVDTLLGWFDSSGNLVTQDDDEGEGVLSKLTGIVPNDGTLTFAVTGSGDINFRANHTELGLYELRVTLAAVPEPGGVALFALAALGCSIKRQASRI